MEHTIYNNHLSNNGKYSILTLRKSIENLHTVFSLYGNANVIVTLQNLLQLAYSFEQDPMFDLQRYTVDSMLDSDTMELINKYLPTNVADVNVSYNNQRTISDLTNLCKQVVLDLVDLVEVLRTQLDLDLYMYSGYITEIIGEDNFTVSIRYTIP